MTRKHHAGEHATTPNARGRSILPLPDEVVAQIKSSTAIVSLTGVVLGLLHNSLDAKASRIDATVDFARGGCTVEDDGLGISPVEFRDGGGLGKLYCTSKYNSHDALLGRNGTFLAALAAMSLLTITSRHHEHRSHNSIIFLHSKATERRLPAPAYCEVHGKHGTRVTVRNLFGNLPVRVKQRSVVLEQKIELDRLWHGLKREVTGLLLSWRGVASLKIRDGDNRVLLNLNTSDSAVAAKSDDASLVKLRSAQLSSMLNLLTQANYITIEEWASWVPASASTSALSVEGAISLDPAPSKHVQFISLGIRPLSAESGQNELYDVVNRLFALSSFGTVDDDTDVNDLETLRHRTDQRHKNEPFTNRQLVARKDVDRYPMFHLRISLKGSHSSILSEDRLIGDETSLQAVIEVLGAMITQWLSVHHFQPRQPRKRRTRPENTSPAPSESFQDESMRIPENRAVSRTTRSATSTASSAIRKRKRPTATISQEPSEKLQHRAFAEWSRIKSANSSFFRNLPTLSKRTSQAPDQSTAVQTRSGNFANFEVEPLPKGVFSACTGDEESSMPVNEPCADDDENDGTMLWTDPSTKKTYALNARTGCLMPDARPRPNTDSATSTLGIMQKELTTTLRLAPRPTTGLTRKTPWLDNVLQTWDNPIFKPSETRIQQVSLEEHEFDAGNHLRSQHQCSHFDINKAFTEASPTVASRLSKCGLQKAKVVAQVDKKFILIKMQSASNTSPEKRADGKLLVLVDQHAADERVQVEALLKELCSPLAGDNVHSSYQSKLGHRAQVTSVTFEKPIQFTISSQEHTHFVTHAARFAAWGILFDILQSTSSAKRPGTSTTHQSLLSVTNLPPAISERCKADPQLLISFLRSTVWKYAEDPHLPPLPAASSTSHTDTDDWVRRLVTCPQGLVDLINSRACRSAIMFNDELRHEECETLVKRLAGCVFPFMCAHGRPSMVPLVDLGRVGDVGDVVVGELGGSGVAEKEEKEFVEAWKEWQGNK